jgi:ATP-dependent Lon protease
MLKYCRELKRPDKPSSLKEGHTTFEENQKGVSYDGILGEYIRGAKLIEVVDPYIRMFFQCRNMMEFLETVARYKDEAEEIGVHLRTIADEYKAEQQEGFFASMQQSIKNVGVNFTWEFDKSNTIHARSIVTDTGWKISLDRGLDIFQQYDMNDAFSVIKLLREAGNVKISILKPSLFQQHGDNCA